MSARHYTIALALLAAIANFNTQAQPSTAVGSLIEQGRYWQARGDFKRAAEVWQKLLVANPGNPDALYGLARVALDANDAGAAANYLERLRAASPQNQLVLRLEQEIYLDQPGPKAELDKARSLAAAQQMDEAIAQYDKVLQGRKPLGNLAREYYNYLGYSSNGLPRAIQGLEGVLSTSPNNLNDQLALAKHLIRTQERRGEGLQILQRLSTQPAVASEATEAWRSALSWIGAPPPAYRDAFLAYLEANPNDDEIRQILAQGKAATKTAGSNRSTASSAPRQDPDLTRGFSLLEAGKLAEAQAAFQSRLQRSPHDADALGGMGLIRMQQNNFADAKTFLAAAASRKSGWKKSLGLVQYWQLVNDANAARAQGNYTQARNLAEQAIGIDRKVAAAYNVVGNSYIDEGQTEAAEKAFRQALKTDARNLEALQGLAQALAQMGQIDDASTLLTRLAANRRLNPSDVSKLRASIATGRAKAALQRGDQASAQQALEAALRDDPDNPWLRLDLARLYIKRGASTEARELVDGLLLSHPTMADAQYSSALLSAELGDWAGAYATLQRIAPGERTAEMNAMAQRAGFHAQATQAATLAQQGKLTEARSILYRLEQSADNDPALLGSIASAYVDTGDPQRGLGLIRTQLQQTGNNNTDVLLSYAGLLMKTGQDTEAATVIQDLQTKTLTAGQKDAYANLTFLYTVRRADLLREQGDLVKAYDTLAPALAQRPNDPAALSALARMHADNGDNKQALDYYKRLLKNNPDDANMQIAAAMAATQLGEKQYAETAINHALGIAPENPEILANAARLYRAQGKTSKAMDLLAAAVAAENKRLAVATPQAVTVAATPVQPSVYNNPFAQKTTAQQTPPPRTLGSVNAALPAEVALSPSASADRPGVVTESTRLSALNQELSELRDLRNPQITLSTTGRSNNGESGLSKLNDLQTSLLVRMPVQDGTLALEATAVQLKSGEVDPSYYNSDRFGAGPVAIYDDVAKNNRWGDPRALDNSGPSGKQRDSGIGVSVAYEYQGLRVDLGTTPLGFRRTNLIGGIKYEGLFNAQSRTWYSVDLSRRAVTDSLTSFAGVYDSRTGQSWGGVTSSGLQVQAGQDTDSFGYYGYAGWHALQGQNVASNSRTNIGAGVYWHLVRDTDQILTAGLNLGATFYDKNQRFFTYGHGGYFSPQSMYSLSVPFTWAQRSGRFSYKLQGALGLEHFKEDGADYFPTDSALQARAGTATDYARSMGFAGATNRYSGQSKTGLSYNLQAAAEYRLTDHLVMGSQLGLNNAKDYRQWAGGLYLRYTIYPSKRALDLPVKPYRGPYAN